MALLVTPDQMRTVSNSIQGALEQAVAVAKQYVNTHQDAMNATWGGLGAGASNTTAIKIDEDITKIITGGRHLADGLNNAAALMEAHEEEQAHTFNGFVGH